MPLVPERLAARSETRAALDAQFWEQGVASARSLDGVARTAPADPPPLGQLTPQGASRPQQLLIIQAGVGPVAPGYDASNGGAVSLGEMGMDGGRRQDLSHALSLSLSPQARTHTPIRSRPYLSPPPHFLISCTASWPAWAPAAGGPPCPAGPACSAWRRPTSWAPL